jgi:hypothetical protein
MNGKRRSTIGLPKSCRRSDSVPLNEIKLVLIYAPEGQQCFGIK